MVTVRLSVLVTPAVKVTAVFPVGKKLVSAEAKLAEEAKHGAEATQRAEAAEKAAEAAKRSAEEAEKRAAANATPGGGKKLAAQPAKPKLTEAA